MGVIRLAAPRRDARRGRRKAPPRVPAALSSLPPSTADACMRAADAISHFERARALAAAGEARSGSADSGDSRGSSGSGGSGSGGSGSGAGRRSRRSRRRRRKQSVGGAQGDDELAAPQRDSRSGSVGAFEIRPLGSAGEASAAETAEAERLRRKEERARRRAMAKDAAGFASSLPPIQGVAGGSITMTVGSSGTGHVGAAAGAGALLIGREAKELGDLGGVISPTSLEDFNFQTAFVTPEMVRPPPLACSHRVRIPVADCRHACVPSLRAHSWAVMTPDCTDSPPLHFTHLIGFAQTLS